MNRTDAQRDSRQPITSGDDSPQGELPAPSPLSDRREQLERAEKRSSWWWGLLLVAVVLAFIVLFARPH